jgi:hypothetical protein
MDGLCRAQGRVGTPQRGNPPRMYTLLRYRNSLEHVCSKAEARALPPAYPPTILLGIHVRAQLSAALCLEGGPGEGGGTARGIDAKAASLLGTVDAFVETKYDGFRLQLHWEHGAMRCFYRSGVECTADVADLLPAVRLALGGLSGDGDALRGERLTYVRRAWERRGGAPPSRRDRSRASYSTASYSCTTSRRPRRVRTTSWVPRRGSLWPSA